MDRLDRSQGRWAVEHARTVVESVVEDGPRPPVPDQVDEAFERRRGAFVTLEKRGSLRGCIGRPRPEQTALDAIRDAAAGAARNDPRFPPVTASELSAITVEVSVLSTPESIAAEAPERRPAFVEVGRDGLIVRGEERSGLLLPQVPVDRDWDAVTFLEQTCRKAGLSKDCWRTNDVAVERFYAQVFAEREPGGPVEPVSTVPEVEP